jgi:thiol-disulfide isomerase/thioredoxin
VRVIAYVGILAIGLGPVAGCGLFSKNKQNTTAAPAGGRGGSVAAAGPVPGSAVFNATPTPAPTGGILAGQVIDSYNRRLTGSMIQVALIKDGDDTAGAAVREVATDANGYFTIPNLDLGRSYQLTARIQDGNRMMAGTTIVRTPNPRVLIRVSEDFVGPTTPALPAPPSTTPSSPGTNNIGSNAGVGLGTPGSIGPGSAPPAVAAPRPQDVPHLIVTPPWFKPDAKASSPGTPAAPSAATAVPSCQLTGQHLENFALNDLNGGTWEFRQHKGKLVLLDFWGTWCPPCCEAIPHLKILHQLYAPYNLEVVGIAYESGAPQAQARKVTALRDRLKIPYRLLLGSGKDNPCPVRDQFQIDAYPTLILLDETGQIIWRSNGGLDQYQLRTLENEISRRLVR